MKRLVKALGFEDLIERAVDLDMRIGLAGRHEEFIKNLEVQDLKHYTPRMPALAV